MPEEPKNIRLNKAAKELNVGIPTLVEYLAKKGHQVDANPNARLTPEQYALLATAFQSERQVKENADRIEISTGSSVVIEATNASNDDEAHDYGDEVIIKNFTTPKSKESAKPEKTAEKEKSISDETYTEAEEQPAQTIETEPEPEPEPEPLPKFEAQVLRSSVAGAKEGKNAFDAEVHIVDKIDLDTLNARLRPVTVKTKNEKSKKEKKAKESKETTDTTKNAKKKGNEGQKAKNTKPSEPKQPEPKPVETTVPEKTEAKAPEKEIEFIETHVKEMA